jgi:pimeloyl-ACP methyl ester carboxylesterase
MLTRYLLCLALLVSVQALSSLKSRVMRTSVTTEGPGPVYLICPGFGNDEKDYINPLEKGIDVGFVAGLSKRGVDAEVVKISRLEWLKLLGPSLTNPVKFANNEMTTEILYGFYLARVRKQIKEIESRGRKVVLVGHSAGGWLVRRIVGEEEAVLGLVSLGTPHFPASMNCATRGALRKYDTDLPGAYFKGRGKFYVTVGGTAVKAAAGAEKGDPAYFATDAYLAVTGRNRESIDGTVGDGVVPTDFTLLQGSKQLVLQGVYHSIQAPGDYWYGGDGVIDQWLPSVRREIGATTPLKERDALTGDDSSRGSGRVSLIEDGVGPWTKAVFGDDFMRIFAIVIGTGPYAAMILKFIGAFDN